MKNQKQIKKHAGDRGSAQAIPRALRGDQLVGYLLYREDTEEFFHSSKVVVECFSACAWTSHPGVAHVFSTLQKAFSFSESLKNPTQAVPFYDTGDSFVVGFE